MDPTTRDEILSRYGARRSELLARRRQRETELPVGFLRQTSHFTTPATRLETIEKAAAGLSGALGLLAKLGLTTADVAGALECPVALVEQVAAGGAAPLVMVDGEDATSPDPAVIARGRENAVTAFATVDFRGALAFYRPSGLELESCVADLVRVIEGTAERTASRPFPIDGVTWPKAAHEEELLFLDDLLSELEGACGLVRRSIRVAFLVESGRALARLEKLVEASLPRLAAVIWGSADYAADVGLPRAANDHPAFVRARSSIVELAGAVGVPAIDGMTFEYPVRDPALDAPANRARILAALRRCFDDARHGIALGMEGKWVGHPLQLLANEVAYRSLLDPAAIARDVGEARAYREALAKGLGAAAIGGAMADRATDRHARRRLRRALAHGALAADVAAELGVR